MLDAGRQEGHGFDQPLNIRIGDGITRHIQPARNLRVLLREIRPFPAQEG